LNCNLDTNLSDDPGFPVAGRRLGSSPPPLSSAAAIAAAVPCRRRRSQLLPRPSPPVVAAAGGGHLATVAVHPCRRGRRCWTDRRRLPPSPLGFAPASVATASAPRPSPPVSEDVVAPLFAG
jgi:hypothetical protein